MPFHVSLGPYFNPRSPCGERHRSCFPLCRLGHFNPRSPCGERPGGGHQCRDRAVYFNPRSPCGERLRSRLRGARPGYFNPRSPCGERRQEIGVVEADAAFQSTLSLRRATAILRHGHQQEPDFNPRSPCGERPIHNVGNNIPDDISIHALLAESDGGPCQDHRFHARFQSTLSLRRATLRRGTDVGKCPNFNPRSPCGERLQRPVKRPRRQRFQSTLSLRRATTAGQVLTKTADDFNPRSPCGERLAGVDSTAEDAVFQSTLSLRRATPTWGLSRRTSRFQSTLSLRRATALSDGRDAGIGISIHALLAESDAHSPSGVTAHLISIHALLAESDDEAIGSRLYEMSISIHALLAESDIGSYSRFAGESNFNPRSPCGERLPCVVAFTQNQNFNPRSPCGERPPGFRCPAHGAAISIHALLAESDRTERRQPLTRRYFNPRSPCGERRSTVRWGDVYSQFQSTLSLRRATLGGDLHLDFAGISIHALLAESDRLGCPPGYFLVHFNPRSPCGERLDSKGRVLLLHADFNPRSPCGERPSSTWSSPGCERFQSTLSLRRATRIYAQYKYI